MSDQEQEAPKWPICRCKYRVELTRDGGTTWTQSAIFDDEREAVLAARHLGRYYQTQGEKEKVQSRVRIIPTNEKAKSRFDEDMKEAISTMECFAGYKMYLGDVIHLDSWDVIGKKILIGVGVAQAVRNYWLDEKFVEELGTGDDPAYCEFAARLSEFRASCEHLLESTRKWAHATIEDDQYGEECEDHSFEEFSTEGCIWEDFAQEEVEADEVAIYGLARGEDHRQSEIDFSDIEEDAA